MKLLSRTAEIWNEKPPAEPKQKVRTTDDQGLTLFAIKKNEEPRRGSGQPRKVVKAPAAPKIPVTVAPPPGPTLRRAKSI